MPPCMEECAAQLAARCSNSYKSKIDAELVNSFWKWTLLQSPTAIFLSNSFKALIFVFLMLSLSVIIKRCWHIMQQFVYSSLGTQSTLKTVSSWAWQSNPAHQRGHHLRSLQQQQVHIFAAPEVPIGRVSACVSSAALAVSTEASPVCCDPQRVPRARKLIHSLRGPDVRKINKRQFLIIFYYI